MIPRLRPGAAVILCLGLAALDLAGLWGILAQRRPVTPAPERLTLNQATSREFRRVKGLGPALAGRIIARRRQLGRFQRPADLQGIPSLGKARQAQLLEEFTLVDSSQPSLYPNR